MSSEAQKILDGQTDKVIEQIFSCVKEKKDSNMQNSLKIMKPLKNKDYLFYSP